MLWLIFNIYCNILQDINDKHMLSTKQTFYFYGLNYFGILVESLSNIFPFPHSVNYNKSAFYFGMQIAFKSTQCRDFSTLSISKQFFHIIFCFSFFVAFLWVGDNVGGRRRRGRSRNEALTFGKRLFRGLELLYSVYNRKECFVTPAVDIYVIHLPVALHNNRWDSADRCLESWV